MSTVSLTRRTAHRGVAYSTVQEPAGGWIWKVLPASVFYACEALANGTRPTRDDADAAARAAIDAQLDC